MAIHPALDPVRVERLLKAAKSEPLPFAFARDPKAETGILAADKTKTGKALLEICRKESGAKKGAYGTVSIDGVNATFVCERNELTQLSKALLGWLKAQKISLKVSVAAEDEAGEEAEETAVEEEPENTSATIEKSERGAGTTPVEEKNTEDDSEDEAEEEEVPEGKIFDPEIVVPLIRRARKRPRPFAFGIGPDIDLLAAHTKADPMRLARKVREEGAKKGIWGMVSMDGAVAVFTCEKEPFSGARKGLKRWIKQQGLTLKFRLEGPDGEFADPEDDEDEDRASALSGLAQKLEALLPALKDRAAADPAQRDIIRKAYADCDSAIKAGNPEQAGSLFSTLEQLLAKPVFEETIEEDTSEGPAGQAALRIADFDSVVTAVDDELEVLRYYSTHPGELDWVPQYKPAFANLVQLENSLAALQNRRPQALLDEQEQDFTALRAHIDAALAELKNVRDQMGHVNPGFSGTQDSPERRRSILAQLVDNPGPQETAAESDAETFEEILEAALAKADDIRTDLQTRLTKLWMAVKSLGGNTPLAREIEPIADITTEADALPHPAQARRKLELWAGALADAKALMDRVEPLGGIRSAIRNALHVAGHLLDQVPDTQDKQDLQGRIDTLTGRIRSEALAAASCQDLVTRWGVVRTDAVAVKADAARLKKRSVYDATLESDLRALVELCKDLLPRKVITAPDEWPPFIDPKSAYSDADIDQQLLKTGDERIALRDEIDADLAAAWAFKIKRLDHSELPAVMDERLQRGDTLPDGVEGQAFWAAAFEKRYGVTLAIPPGMEMKKFPKLYELFARVPRGHVGHDKLKTLDYEVASGAAFYSKAQTKINLSNVSRDLPPDKQAQFQYPVTDGSPDAYHDYFTMVTLHEIGHAADGKNSLMELEKAGLGVWKDSRTETLTTVTDAVAEAISTSTGIDKAALLTAVRQVLVTGGIAKPVGPDAPFGHLHAQWDTVNPEFDTYKVIALATSKSPWETPVEVTGGRCYHEAYPGRWVSYLKAERDGSSVSAYQWRAPGEWFAELYAWYWFAGDDTERGRRAARLPAAIHDAILGVVA